MAANLDRRFDEFARSIINKIIANPYCLEEGRRNNDSVDLMIALTILNLSWRNWARNLPEDKRNAFIEHAERIEPYAEEWIEQGPLYAISKLVGNY